MTSLPSLLKASKFITRDGKREISKAYSFAQKIHGNQVRHYSDELIFTHVCRTARILAELGMAHETISAGLLHHAMREGGIGAKELTKKFGRGVSVLVEGATRLRDIKYRDELRHIESLRKLFVASAVDLRILVIKLADRLDSMRHLFHNIEHHYRIARETMEIYVPLADRLGLRKMKREMEDLAFRYINPKKYFEIYEVLRDTRRQNSESLEKFKKMLISALSARKIRRVNIDSRVKNIYSIYSKTVTRKKDLSSIYDISAVRIQVPGTEDCYRVLGVIHSKCKPIPGRVKDYIAYPKNNGYQSLHTTVVTKQGMVVEIQIRTYDMHRHAEFGIASHISYKERHRRLKDPHYSWFNQFFPPPGRDNTGEGVVKRPSQIPQWIKDVVDVRSYVKFGESETSDSTFFKFRMFVFDKNGEVIDLPVNATAIDFAYELDPGIGDRFDKAIVNGKKCPPGTELKNGDVVEIITKRKPAPKEEWLLFARTPGARSHILSKIHESKSKHAR